MKSDTKKRIIGYVRMNKQAKAIDLARAFHLSRVAIHRHLKALVEKGELKKVGKAPLVFYLLAERKPLIPAFTISNEIKKVIDKNYLYVSPVGEMIDGFEGFVRWIVEIKEEKRIANLAQEYVKTLSEFKPYFSSFGWVDATNKIKNTFQKDSYVNKLLYGDFYTLPKFGKTKLGQLMLYAKQSQNRKLVEKISVIVKPLIEKVIKKFDIKACAFIPPTVPRNIQFMHELKIDLNLRIPEIDLVKSSSGEIVIPQKTLTRLEERITNARETIFLKNREAFFSNILLIDDAAGSGATFNETARKLKDIKPEKGNIIAFAIVGSIKGFEVIREV